MNGLTNATLRPPLGPHGNLREVRAPLSEALERLPRPSDLRDVVNPSGLQIAPPRFGPALPSPLRPRPLGLSMPWLGGGAVYPQLAPVLDSATNIRPYYARPGLFYLVPGGFPQHEAFIARSWGIFGAAPYTSDHVRTVPAFILDASALTVRASEPLFGIRVGPQIAVGDGYAFAGGNFTALRGSMLSTTLIGVVGWSDSLGISGRWARVNLNTGMYALAGGSASISASRGVQDLGRYLGDDAHRIAATLHMGPGDVLRAIEVTRQRGVSASVNGGGGNIFAAVQARLAVSRRHRHIFRTYLPEYQAQPLLNESGCCLWRHLRNVKRGLRWSTEPVAIPSLRLPEAFALGDELVDTTSRTFLGGSSFGNLGVWAGCQVIRQIDYETRVRKVSPHHIEVLCTPSRLEGLGVFVASPLSPQATLDRTTARTLRQGFVFDLREPAARAAYQAVLDGTLPGSLPNHVEGDVREIARSATHLREVLPDGVKRTYTQGIAASELRDGGGIHFYFIPRAWLPNGWTPGFTVHQIRGVEDQVVVHGDTMSLLHTRAKERRYEMGIRGIRSVRVAATLGHDSKAPFKDAEFTGLRLDAVFSGSYRRVSDVNHGLVEPLNRLFKLHVTPIHCQLSRARRGVLVGRRLQEDELDQLAEVGKECGAFFMGDRANATLATSLAAATTGVSHRALRRFLIRAGGAGSTLCQALVTQEFVGSAALGGFAAVHGLLGAQKEDLLLKGNSETYTQVLTSAAALQLQCTPPGKPQPQKVADMLKKLEHAADTLGQDTLLDATERARVALLLTEAERTLAPLAADCPVKA